MVVVSRFCVGVCIDIVRVVGIVLVIVVVCG